MFKQTLNHCEYTIRKHNKIGMDNNMSFNVTLSLAFKTAAKWHVVLSLSYKVTAARSNCACHVRGS